MSRSLLKFQIGPVQDFIAASRSTRDLWSGSYLLSFLIAAGLRKLRETPDSALIFPNPEGQPLLDAPDSWKDLPEQQSLLTPNLPNLFVAEIPSVDAKALAESIAETIKNQWREIADAVWEVHSKLEISDTKKSFFDQQVARHLSIAWQITPLGESYPESYKTNGKQLDAVRQLRDFDAWGEGRCTITDDKDSLTGKEDSLCGGIDFLKDMAGLAKKIPKEEPNYPSLFKHSDHVGAITLIKRTWHFAYLEAELGLKTKQLEIRSIPAIAARRSKLDDDEQAQEKTSGDKYLAAIAFDGDSIGKWVNGENLNGKDKSDLRDHQQTFSRCLSDFALGRAWDIVEAPMKGKDGKEIPLGFLIYAGGDDVVALVPADIALDCAKKLRDAFCKCTTEIKGKDNEGKNISPDASAGIAIAHIHSPLQDLIREAQKAEKRAKNTVGRPAFSVTLMKRSGEISQWGSQWKSGGLDLYQAITKLLNEGNLSGKFPHRVSQLLSPYLTSVSGLAKQADALDTTTSIDLITREFTFAIERQSSAGHKKSNLESLIPVLGKYLNGILAARDKRQENSSAEPTSTKTQELLTSLIALCATVAFTHRTRPEPAEKQATS